MADAAAGGAAAGGSTETLIANAREALEALLTAGIGRGSGAEVEQLRGEVERLQGRLETVEVERDLLRALLEKAMTNETRRGRKKLNETAQAFRRSVDVRLLQSEAASDAASSDGESAVAEPIAKSTPLGKEHGRFKLLMCSDEECHLVDPPDGCFRRQHTSTTTCKLKWDTPPLHVLIIKKPRDANAERALIEVAAYLGKEKGMVVFVEPGVHRELAAAGKRHGVEIETWDETMVAGTLHQMIDLVVCLGGDGTILWASKLFRLAVPPIISFALGSLGFLTPFSFGDYRSSLDKAIRGGFTVSLRSRLAYKVVRACDRCKVKAVEEEFSHANFHFEGGLQSLNEVVVARGPNATMVTLDAYCDGDFVTRIHADGVIIGTPNGSTAYSMSAGGPIVHPSVPCMLLTPICPHSLSFRSITFPDSATMRIEVPVTARFTALVTLDGKNQFELQRGDSIIVKISPYPLPAICREEEHRDWFRSLKEGLHWNIRADQKPISKV